jgi:4-amino-4-deoxy-L-arabinose transferase-like glycosyltransferase
MTAESKLRSSSPALRRALVVTALATLAVRLPPLVVVARSPERAFTPDSWEYHRAATNWLERGVLSTDAEPPLRPTARRTPGYPLFLAGHYAAGLGVNSVLLTQWVLDAATALLVVAVFVERFGRGGALAAGLFYAVSLAPVVSCGQVLSETLFNFLLMVHLWALGRGLRGAVGIRLAVLSGACLGGAILCRPLAAGLPALELLLLIARKTRRQRSRPTAVSTALALLVVAPWVVRNWLVFGRPFVSTVGAYNALFVEAGVLEARDSGRLLTDVQQDWKTEFAAVRRARGAGFSEYDESRLWLAKASPVLRRQPLRLAAVHLRSDVNALMPAVTKLLELVGATQGGRGTLSVLHRAGVVAAVRHYFGGKTALLWLCLPLVLLHVALLSVACLGAIRLVRDRRSEWLPLAALFAYFFLPPGPVADFRFQTLLVPIMALWAGYFAHSVEHLHAAATSPFGNASPQAGG